MKNTILTLIGLFIPLKIRGQWRTSMSFGHIPLGWIIVGISILVNFLMK